MTSDRRPPVRLDFAPAAGCGVVTLGLLVLLPQIARLDPSTPVGLPAAGSLGWWSCVGALLVQAFALLWGRVAPRLVLLVVAAVPVPLAVAPVGDVFTLSSAAVLVAVALAGIRRPIGTLRGTLVISTGMLLVAGSVAQFGTGQLGPAASVLAAAIQTITVIGLPLLLAMAVSGRRDARTSRLQELRAVSREHDALVRAAVADERTTMARELHDIAAHHLSGIALMTSAIERQIDADPQAARRSARQVRTQSTAVLDDLRRLVGLLRSDESDPPYSVHTLTTVADLIEQRRAAGMQIEFRVLAEDEEPLGHGVGPLGQLATYRMVQESLANVARHAPGAACVVEIDDRDEEKVTVLVANDRRSTAASVTGSSGFGLIGMQERADLVGAILRSGRRADGGWQVRWEVPRERGERSRSVAGATEVPS